MTFAPGKLLIGASWYPENWREADWIADCDRMAKLGFNLMRVFEFAWHRFEPSEGQVDFSWALRCLDLLAERGIGAMVGTPTAAPPAWLTTKYPEVLKTSREGRRAAHGKRCHRSALSACYREHCKRIAGKMAEVFAGHPALHSWQIDNEMGGADYGPEAQIAFRAYLKRRFGTIEQLNQSWGLEFWSQAYDSFDQIEMCNGEVGSREVPERAHPSLILAVSEFQNECWDGFIADQCAAIRAYSDKPISSNMVGLVGGMDWSRLNKNFDFVGASMYSDLSYYRLNFARFDRMRAEKPGSPYMLMETAPNWSGGGPIWNIHHCGAGVRMFSWLNTISGSCATIFWQWRSHWAGQEMQHGTHVSATGKFMPGKEDWTLLAKEYREQGEWLLANPAGTADVAIMLSSQAAWAFSIDPIDPKNLYQERWRDDYYLPLVRNHIYRDVITQDAGLSPYKVLMLPHMPVLTDDLRARVRAWVEAGGVLLLGPLSGYRSEEFTAFTDREFGGLEELMGADCATRFSPMWVENEIDIAFTDGQSCHPRHWCDAFTPTSATALATYQGGWGSGHTAILENRFGQGTVITLGTLVDEPTWLKLVERALEIAGVAKVAEGSPEVLVAPRVNATGATIGYGIVNSVKTPQTITLPAAGTDRLTGKPVGPEITLEPMQYQLVEFDEPVS